MRLRQSSLPLLVGILACADPGHRVLITQPVVARVGRACAAEALRHDSTFRVIDSIAHPWRAREDSASIGTFKWFVSGQVYGQGGDLAHHFGRAADTVVATTFWIGGTPQRREIDQAVLELRQRLTLVVEHCTRSSAPAVCTFDTNGVVRESCLDV